MNLNNTAVKPKNDTGAKVIKAFAETLGMSVLEVYIKGCYALAFIGGGNDFDRDSMELITLDQLIWESGIAPDDAVELRQFEQGDDGVWHSYIWVNSDGWTLEFYNGNSFSEHENYKVCPLISTRPQQEETKQYMPEVGEEWNGEGIPPKGLECSIRFKVDLTSWSEWRKGFFKGGYDSKVWLGQSDLQADDLILFSHDVEFKPLKTKEEEEREEFISYYTNIRIKSEVKLEHVLGEIYDKHIKSKE